VSCGKLCPALSGDGGLRLRPSAYYCGFSSDEGEGSREDNLLAERHDLNVLVERAQSRVRQTPFLFLSFSGLRGEVKRGLAWSPLLTEPTR
jgi:hypothetical protein